MFYGEDPKYDAAPINKAAYVLKDKRTQCAYTHDCSSPKAKIHVPYLTSHV
jgi:hypothetical protein